ncbi:unnamed protein product [Cyclocybe aegerita]|uniref:Uncharacterized protein n=1 Tax=Cyclocybe aegerita TaxID=1973307 RepID=A0A8S0WHH5_CYCAE|nr:unnamed protein product [Cyclocybe aegerita]
MHLAQSIHSRPPTMGEMVHNDEEICFLIVGTFSLSKSGAGVPQTTGNSARALFPALFGYVDTTRPQPRALAPAAKPSAVPQQVDCITTVLTYEDTLLEYYNKLTSAVNSAVVVKWTKEIEDAEVKRLKQPEAMDIMNTRIPKSPTLAKAGKTFAQIEGLGFSGETSWLISGLRLEELQVEVSAVACQVAKQPNLKNLTVLVSKREKLMQQITKFNEEALKYMGEDAFDSLIGVLEWIDKDFTDSDGSDDEIDSDPCAGRGQYCPEDACLPFPSRVEDALRLKLGLTRLATKELDLRKAFANDCLQNIQLAVGDKSFHYKNHLWLEKTKKKCT